MDRVVVARWLSAYTEAWRTYDRDKIVALFTDDARCRYQPFEEPIVGSEAIADTWFDDPDAPGTYEGAYEPFAVDGDRAAAIGSSTYTEAGGSIRAIYDNCFLLRFAEDGRCREFTEFYVKRPRP